MAETKFRVVFPARLRREIVGALDRARARSEVIRHSGSSFECCISADDFGDKPSVGIGGSSRAATKNAICPDVAPMGCPGPKVV